MVCIRKWFGVVWCMTLFLCPSDVFGLDSFQLDEIVVTATRSDAARNQVGSSVTVISRDEIERSQKSFVLDLLRSVPAVDVTRSGGPGGQTYVGIRGAKSEHTLVLVDGVRVNDSASTGGSFDFANLPTDTIERIEILRGPQSTLYGSDAMGGVITIITRRGEGKPTGFISAQGGSFSTAREQASVSGGAGPLNFSLGLSREDTRGISSAGEQYGNHETDGYHATSVSTRLGVAPSRNFDFDCIVRYLDTKADLDNGGGAGQDDPNSIVRSEQVLVRGQGRLSLFNDRWEQKLGISFTNLDRNYRNDTDTSHPEDSDRASYHGQSLAFDWQHTMRLHKTNTMTLGVETREEKAHSDYYSESFYGPYSSVFPEESDRITGYYLQDRISLWDAWFTTLGVRLDDHSRFGTEATYRFTTSYLVKQTATRIKGSYGTGFKAPSLYELYEPTYGNQALNPEKSTGWDIGVEQALIGGRMELGATWFSNDFKNLIEFDSGASKYKNTARAESYGVEFTATATPIDDLTLRAGYTWMKTEDKSTGKELLRRPENKVTLDANYRFNKKGNVNLGIAYVGKRQDTCYDPITYVSTRVELGGYLLVNLAASYDVTKWLQVFARVDNLLDREYEEVYGYGTPGISGYGGVKVSF
jgi:vitamin B12 transporter